jgi:hypothetical protein
MALETLLAASTSLLGFGVLLKLFCQEQFADRPVRGEVNHAAHG